jgi:Pentapeptide repeats (8 copies)
MTMIRLAGRFRAVGGRTRHVTGGDLLAALTVAVAALTGGGSALAATTPGPIALSYLFSVPAASGSLTGPNDQHLTLRLTGTRDYLSRFTDRPLRQAFVVANVDFARRFKHYFASSRPNAVLTYTRSGGQIPVSIGLTIGQPRWDAHHHTWTFPATRIRKHTDNLPGTTIHIKPPLIPTPRSFTRGTLLIDDSENCGQGVFEPYEDCEAADLAFVDLTGADLTGVNFTDANLTDANLTGVNLTGVNFTGADLSGADLTGSDLTGSDLTGEDLSGEVFIGSDLADVDLTGANLTGTELPGVNLAFANLTGVNLTDADLAIADLTDADLTDADVSGADFVGARVCGAILPEGSIGGGC